MFLLAENSYLTIKLHTENLCKFYDATVLESSAASKKHISVWCEDLLRSNVFTIMKCIGHCEYEISNHW